jgi:hypothetical protein
LMFREDNTDQSELWKKLFKLLSIQIESAIVELSNESIKFRLISVKSYYQDDHADDEKSSSLNIFSLIEFENDYFAIDSIVRIFIHHESFVSSFKRGRERSRKYFASTRLIAELNFEHVEQFDSIQISNRTWLFVRRIESNLICCSTFEFNSYKLFEILD